MQICVLKLSTQKGENMKKKKSVRIKVCMLVGAFLLLGSGVPANAKAVPKLSRKKVTVTVGKKTKLKVKNGKGKKILWKSTNKKIATVKRTGKNTAIIRAKKSGKTTVVAKIGKKKLKCKVVVKKGGRINSKSKKKNVPNDVKNQLPKQTSVVKTYLYDLTRLPINKPVDLFGYMYQGARKLHVTSDFVKSKYYKWFSSDPSVVTVNKYGVATAKRIGTANIYFKYMTKAGKWETSVSSKVKVMDKGNVTFSYKVGYDEALANKPGLPKRYIARGDNPDLMNYVIVTITNHSDSEIKFMDVSINPYNIWFHLKPTSGEMVTVCPGETTTVVCDDAYEFDYIFEKYDHVAATFAYDASYRVNFIYLYKGKGASASYDLRNNCWKY